MYGHMNTSLYDHSSDFLTQYYHSLTTDFDSSAPDTFMLGTGNANGSSSASGCTSSSYIGSPSSPLSCCTSSHPPNTTNTTSMIQRSLSSHSLYKNVLQHPVSSPPTAPLHDPDGGPVRRVFSTGDLDQGVDTLRGHQHHRQRGGSPLSNESTSVIIEGMSKACRYSPEEKRERIERYRTKRSQRNFNKKIQYVCRKTLADSRPRVRGRFARNDEIEKTNNSSALQWSQMALTGAEDEEDEEHWMHLLDSISSSLVP